MRCAVLDCESFGGVYPSLTQFSLCLLEDMIDVQQDDVV